LKIAAGVALGILLYQGIFVMGTKASVQIAEMRYKAQARKAFSDEVERGVQKMLDDQGKARKEERLRKKRSEFYSLSNPKRNEEAAELWEQLKKELKETMVISAATQKKEDKFFKKYGNVPVCYTREDTFVFNDLCDAPSDFLIEVSLRDIDEFESNPKRSKEAEKLWEQLKKEVTERGSPTEETQKKTEEYISKYGKHPECYLTIGNLEKHSICR
jgi:hypothetical protein